MIYVIYAGKSLMNRTERWKISIKKHRELFFVGKVFAMERSILFDTFALTFTTACE